MMAIAIIFAISFLAPNNRTFIAFIGGCGLRLVHRRAREVHHPRRQLLLPADDRAHLHRVRRACTSCSAASSGASFGPDEAVLNGLEALKSAAHRRAERAASPRRRSTLLDQTGADDPLAASGAHAARRRDRPARPAARTGSSGGGSHDAGVVPAASPNAAGSCAPSPWWFVVVAVAHAGRGSRARARRPRGSRASSTGRPSSSSAVVGRADHRRCGAAPRITGVEAYRWFERGILVQIFVTQVFEFAQRAARPASSGSWSTSCSGSRSGR